MRWASCTIWAFAALTTLSQTGMARAQAIPSKPAVIAAADLAIDVAEALIGRALFLRGSYLEDNLAYDASGHVQGNPKPGEWTLSGIDLKKVERRGPKEIVLQGVRVAIRYNPDNHQFERHPQNDEPIKLLLADAGTTQGVEAALDAIFAQGIDPRLQQSARPYWQHYFNPALAWPPDALTGQTVLGLNGVPATAPNTTPPSFAHKVDLKMTPLSQKDKVRGMLQLRLVVDAAGTPQHIAVAVPLGYGLEERAVDAVSQWRFTPAMRDGQPVAAALTLNLDVQLPAAAH